MIQIIISFHALAPTCGNQPSLCDIFTPINNFSALRYKKGEQVYVRYGKRSNKFLLTWYGFASLKNKFNSFSFRVRFLSVSPFSLLILASHGS